MDSHTISTARSTSHKLKSVSLIFLFVLCTLSLSGCATKVERADRLTEIQLYNEAQQAIDNGQFTIAIERLQALETRYPFGRYTQQAQLLSVYAHYKGLEYDTAAILAERFIRLNPDHEELDYAQYMLGLAEFSVDRGLLERMIPSDYSERDMGTARKSYNHFNRLISRYPNSRYAADARQRMLYIRNLLARYEVNVADFNMRRGAYVAASKRAKYVIDNYQGTPATADALAIMVRAYQRLGIDDLAQQSLSLLALNYPDYEFLDSNGQLKEDPSLPIDDPSWLNIISFGLLGS